VVMFLGVSVSGVMDAGENPLLYSLLDTFDRHADAVWMFLAAAILVALLIPLWGTLMTLRQFLFIAVTTGILETVGVLTGFPFGDYEYTNRYGFRLFGTLPLAIPFAWFVVVAGGGAAVSSLLPALGRWRRALAVAFLAVLTDLNLEPIAWKLRGYWLWYPDELEPPGHPPFCNYLAWFVIAFVVALWLPKSLPDSDSREASARALRPLWLLVILNGVLLLGHAGMIIRQ